MNARWASAFRGGRRRPWRQRAGIAAVALALLAGVGGAFAATPATTASQPAGDLVKTRTAPGLGSADTADGKPQPDAITVPQAHTGAGWAEHPLTVQVQAWTSATKPQLARTTPTGYTPATLRSYLGLTGTGAGQTVAVVDAYDNPYAQADLATFSKQFGLPEPCAKGVKKGCFAFSSVQPFGVASSDPGWALESDLDVQMVHAVAPGAAIVLVEARDPSLVALDQAVDYAASLHAAVISNSYGFNGEFDGETAGNGHCALKSALCVYSTGDSGYPGGYPAYDPSVLAVGGTTLFLTPSGSVDFETGWCCTAGATGGGISAYEPRPPYQDAVNTSAHRSIPDVSFDADPYTGVPVYDTYGLNGQNGWFQVGGTSAGAPAWAGIVAAADQLRAKAGQPPLAGAGFQAQRILYGLPHSAFSDITSGVDNRGGCAAAIATCQAGPGYDSVTGLGSPKPGIDTALAAR